MTAKEAYIKAVAAQKRLPELEPIIIEDAYRAYCYALNVIKGRWLEAEPAIIQNAQYAVYYALTVIQGRWQEAELIIMQSPYDAYRYARDVIKGRWLEVEPIIAKSDDQTDYIEHFFDETVVTKDEVDIIQWERKQQVGYFAPASLFKDQVSLLDMVME